MRGYYLGQDAPRLISSNEHAKELQGDVFPNFLYEHSPIVLPSIQINVLKDPRSRDEITSLVPRWENPSGNELMPKNQLSAGS